MLVRLLMLLLMRLRYVPVDVKVSRRLWELYLDPFQVGSYEHLATETGSTDAGRCRGGGGGVGGGAGIEVRRSQGRSRWVWQCPFQGMEIEPH